MGFYRWEQTMPHLLWLIFGTLGMETESAVFENSLVLVNLPPLFTCLKIIRTMGFDSEYFCINISLRKLENTKGKGRGQHLLLYT